MKEKINSDELLLLISNTLEETFIQQTTVGYGYAQLVESIGLTPDQRKYMGSLKLNQVKMANYVRKLKEIIDNRDILPTTKKFPDKEFIDLDI